MTVYLGADHGGFELKERLQTWLEQVGYQVVDLGPSQLKDDDDYPDVALPLAERVAAEPESRGILLCRSGGGMVIAANKVAGARAVAVASPAEAEHARQHNDANVMSLAADWVEADQVEPTVTTFLETPFSDADRHQRRLAKVSQYEQSR